MPAQSQSRPELNNKSSSAIYRIAQPTALTLLLIIGVAWISFMPPMSSDSSPLVRVPAPPSQLQVGSNSNSVGSGFSSKSAQSGNRQKEISNESEKESVKINKSAKSGNTKIDKESKSDIDIDGTPGKNVASYGSLGLAQCPWMTIPKSSRYPRISETKKPQGSTSKFHTCLKALNGEWRKNTIRYTPIGGFLLSAIARGQFHGHSNDLDFDNIVVGEVASAKKNSGCTGVHLGNWGTVTAKIVPNQTYLNNNPTTIFQGDLPLCECELWDLPIPCMVNTVEYLQWDYGPSWWFPVPSSKGTGWRIVDRIKAKNPRKGQSWKNFDQKVFTMLKGVDKDGDMSVSMFEFVITVMSNKDLNLNWVKYQVENNPCMMIDNARRHFNSLLGFFDQYLSGNIVGARQFMGDLFDANDDSGRFVDTFPYKYLPRHMYNLDENEVCAAAVKEEFRKHGLFEK